MRMIGWVGVLLVVTVLVVLVVEVAGVALCGGGFGMVIWMGVEEFSIEAGNWMSCIRPSGNLMASCTGLFEFAFTLLPASRLGMILMVVVVGAAG